MFEKTVADVLSKHLGSFLEVDPESVRTSVWSGCLELRDVQLKASAFASLGVPVSLAGGVVGLIKLDIPWHCFGQAPVKVHMDSVFACVRLQQTGFAADDAVLFKRTALAADEAAWQAATNMSGEEAPPNSLFVQKIIDNVELNLTNLHIRFEDSVSCPASPFALGVTLDCMSVRSADDAWAEKFIETPMQLLHKVVRLGGAAHWASEWCEWAVDEPGLGLGVYVQALRAGPAPGCGNETWRQQMRQMAHPTPTTTGVDTSYIMHPVSAAIRVTIDQHAGRGAVGGAQPVYELIRSVPFSEPVLEAWLHVDEVALVLEHETIQRFASLGAWVARKDLPPAPVRACPRSRATGWSIEWWRWAYDCIRRPRTDWSWDTLRRACKLRRSYAGTTTLAARPVPTTDSDQHHHNHRDDDDDDDDDDGFHTADEDEQDETSSSPGVESMRARLARLTRVAQMTDASSAQERQYGWYERKAGAETHSWLAPLTPEETDLMRCLEDQLPVAVVQVWRRQALRQLDEDAKLRAAAIPETYSWWSRKQSYLGLSEQQTAFLRAEIGEWKEIAAVSYPTEFVQQKLHLQMDKIRVSLRKQGKGANNGAIAELRFGSVQCTSSIRESSTTTQIKLRSVAVLDQCSARTHFREVLALDVERSREMQYGDSGDDWLDCVLEQNPIEHGTGDRKSGLRLHLEIAPLRLVCYPYLIEMLLDFAQLGGDLQLVVAIATLQASVLQFAAFAKQTGAPDAENLAACSKEEADTRQVLDLDVMLHAPTILIPDDCTKTIASCVRVCLGDLKLVTETSSETQDTFAADVTNLQVELCEVHGFTNAMSNCRQLLGRSGSLAITIKTKARTCAESSVANLDIRTVVHPFAANVSDDQLVSLAAIVSAAASQRMAVQTELAEQGACRNNAVITPGVQSSPVELALKIEFEGISLSLGKGADGLAALEIEMLKIAADQTLDGLLTADVSVRTLVMIDKCSDSKERMPHLVSRAPACIGSSQVGADLLTLKIEKTNARLGLYVVIQPLRVMYNSHVIAQLVDFGQYASQLGQSLSQLEIETDRPTVMPVTEADTRQVLEVDIMLQAPTILIPDSCSKIIPSCVRLCVAEIKLRVLDFADVYRAELTNLHVDLCDLKHGYVASNYVEFVSIPFVVANATKPVPPQRWGDGLIVLQLRSLNDSIVVNLSNQLCEVLTGMKSTVEAAATDATNTEHGSVIMQLTIELSTSLKVKFIDMALTDAGLPPFSPAQHYMLGGEAARLCLKDLKMEASLRIASDAISGTVHLGSLQHLCSIVISDAGLENNVRYLADTNLELAQVALGVNFVLPRTERRAVPGLRVGATVGSIAGNVNDVFLINAIAILSNLTIWQARAFGHTSNDGGDKTTLDVQECKIAGLAEHGRRIQLAVTFERKTAWTWHDCIVPEDAGYIALEKYIEPGTLHRSQGWELKSISLPPGHYSTGTLQSTFVDVITETAMADSWSVVSEQLLPRLLNGELCLGRRDWNFAAAGFEAGVLALPRRQLNRAKATKQAKEFVRLCTSRSALEWETWLHSLQSEEISPGYTFGDATGAVLGGVVEVTGAALDGVLGAGAAMAEGRPLDAASSVVGGGIGAAQAAVGGAAQATESVLGGVVHSAGAVVGALMGAGAEQAKWIWADAGKVGWIGLEAKHRLARETYSMWTRGTFVSIENELRRKHGDDARRGVELQYTDHRTGATVDKAFATPLQCAEWIAVLRARAGD